MSVAVFVPTSYRKRLPSRAYSNVLASFHVTAICPDFTASRLSWLTF